MAAHAVPQTPESSIHSRSPVGQDSVTYDVEHALPTPETERSLEDLEAAVKETPPRSTHAFVNGHMRSGSEPRALGEVIDEDEKSLPQGSPSLRHPRGRLEDSLLPQGSGESYAGALKGETKGGRSIEDTEKDIEAGGIESNSKINGSGETISNSYAGIGIDESPRSPVRKAHKRISSRSLKGKNSQSAMKGSDSAPSEQQNETNGNSEASTKQNEQAKPGQLVYENFNSRSGTNLASIQFGEKFEMSLAQEEDKDISSDPSANTQATGTSSSQRDSALVSGRRAGAGWSRSAIRWAPLNVPLQRRLQTLMVFAHSLSIAAGLALFFVLCTIPLLWPLLLPYLIYVLLSPASTDGKLSQRSERLRRSKIWSLFASYFPARLHRTVELESTRKYIFGYHPHGIISHGAMAAFATEALGFSQLFPGITNTLLTLDSNFRIPLYRDYILRLGLSSVSRESCENLLSKGGPNKEGMGRAITIVVGGARESLDAKPGSLNLVLAKRKGFVKLAVRTGADLVPVLAFGENDIYDQVDAAEHPWIHKAQLGLKKFMGFTVPLFHARGVFNYDVGIMPYRRPINIVVGRPIRVMQSKTPKQDYVEQLHQEYTDELLHIWNEWKDVFAQQRKSELNIIE